MITMAKKTTDVPELLMVPKWKVWLSSLGRIVDATVWLLTFGTYKTSLNAHILYGGIECRKPPILKPTPRVAQDTFADPRTGVVKSSFRDYGVWLHVLQAFCLLADGIVGLLLVETNFASNFAESRLWDEYARPGYRI